MKTTTTIRNLVFAAIAAFTLSSQASQVTPETSVVFQTTAGGDVMAAQANAKKFSPSALPPGSTIKVTEVLLPSVNSPSLGAAEDNVLIDALAGTIPTVSSNVVSPTNYTIVANQLFWYNTVYSQSAPMWAGVLNPASPFQNEFGQNCWALIDLQSASGGDDISMDMIAVNATSSGNALNSTLTFNGLTYTTRAIGIKADGTKITSGDASQKCKRVLVFVLAKEFNGGGTQNGLDQVQNYEGNNFFLTYSATANSDTNTTVSATASIGGTNTSYINPTPFRLAITNMGNGDFKISIPNGQTNRQYNVFFSLNSDMSAKTSLGTIQGNGSIVFGGQTQPVSGSNVLAQAYFSAVGSTNTIRP